MSRTFRLVVGRVARTDIENILNHSAEQFGGPARDRYERLIETGLLDLREDPNRPSSKDRSEIAPGVRTYHLTCCRVRAANEFGSVGRPRHVLIYLAPIDDRVRVLRLIHDSADLESHLLEAAKLSDLD